MQPDLPGEAFGRFPVQEERGISIGSGEQLRSAGPQPPEVGVRQFLGEFLGVVSALARLNLNQPLLSVKDAPT